MATRLLFTCARPHPVPLTLGLGLSSLIAGQSLIQNYKRPGSLLLRCDASPSASAEFSRYQRDAQAPIVKGGRLNPRAVRQISAGSIAGLCCGLAVSVFSKPLALLIGILVMGVQALESRGLHLIPYSRIQRVFHNTDVRSAMQDNVAFKLCFGATFALAAFAEL